MAHDEKAETVRTNMVILISGPEVLTPAETGTVYLSGPNVWFFNGTNQTLIK